MKHHGKIFAPSKVGIDHHKIEAYLNNERIFPTTMEMDLTQLCSRDCPACPYSASKKPGLTLQLPFLDRLFGILGHRTTGLVLSGGEPTIVPHFPATIKLAKKKGFKQIAIISNGANIDRPEVQDALLEHATSIRISLYDWQEADTESLSNTLKKIAGLRRRIDREKSPLELGAAMLTRKAWNHRYGPVGAQAFAAGIDWLYFHPFCVDWEAGTPVQDDQSGTLEEIARLKTVWPENFNVQVPLERYSPLPLKFEKLHGSYFLIQVGADGVNYLGPECKYQKEAALLDLNDYLEDDFLWHPSRLRKIEAANSDNYPYIGTKHRPPIFSDYIQKLIDTRKEHKAWDGLQESPNTFQYPGII
ncbi:MAG: radical SAM protein [Candidatus Margulisiibacteriota bacterium]